MCDVINKIDDMEGESSQKLVIIFENTPEHDEILDLFNIMFKVVELGTKPGFKKDFTQSQTMLAKDIIENWFNDFNYGIEDE